MNKLHLTFDPKEEHWDFTFIENIKAFGIQLLDGPNKVNLILKTYKVVENGFGLVNLHVNVFNVKTLNTSNVILDYLKNGYTYGANQFFKEGLPRLCLKSLDLSYNRIPNEIHYKALPTMDDIMNYLNLHKIKDE